MALVVDSASARYIYTYMDELTPLLFNDLDGPLYHYLKCENVRIEPKYYLPILPVILINGCSGIGTGYSTDIPAFNPLHLIENIKQLMAGLPPIKMVPWYRGFKGEIRVKSEKTFTSHGVYRVLNSQQIEITELPVNEDMCFLEYKRFILSIVTGDINKNSEGKEKDRVHVLTDKLIDAEFDLTDTTIKVVLTFAPGKLAEMMTNQEKFEKDLKLVSSINCTNMHLFNHKGQLQKYNSVEDILKEYYDLRVMYYNKRKEYLLVEYEYDAKKMSAKAEFIRNIHEGKIIINDSVNGKNKPKKKAEIEVQLETLQFPKFTKNKKLAYSVEDAEKDEPDIDDEDEDD